MQTFNSDGVRIAFIDEGEGDPILLIHGFASSVKDNWIDPELGRFSHPERLSRHRHRQPGSRREREALRSEGLRRPADG